MYFIEALRTWRVYQRYLIVIAALYLLGAFLEAVFQHVGVANTGILYSIGGHAAIVGFICLLFASIAGSSLGRHLDHLDFALTKPRARGAFAATVFGVDALGLTIFFITTAIAFTVMHIVLGETHAMVFDASSWYGIMIAFGSMLAWYALVQAVSCDRSAAGWALAAVWGTAVGLMILSAVRLGPGVDALVAALNFFNPLAYLSSVPMEASAGPPPVSLAAHAFAIYLVAGAAAFVALLRWQRVEA